MFLSNVITSKQISTILYVKILWQLLTLINVLETGVGVHPVGVVTQQVEDGVGVGNGRAQALYEGVIVGVGVGVGVDGVEATEHTLVLPSK